MGGRDLKYHRDRVDKTYKHAIYGRTECSSVGKKKRLLGRLGGSVG